MHPGALFALVFALCLALPTNAPGQCEIGEFDLYEEFDCSRDIGCRRWQELKVYDPGGELLFRIYGGEPEAMVFVARASELEPGSSDLLVGHGDGTLVRYSCQGDTLEHWDIAAHWPTAMDRDFCFAIDPVGTGMQAFVVDRRLSSSYWLSVESVPLAWSGGPVLNSLEISWARELDGYDGPFEFGRVFSFRASQDTLMMTTALRNPDSYWYYGDYLDLSFVGSTGEVITPNWIHSMAVDSTDIDRPELIGIEEDGGEAWRTRLEGRLVHATTSRRLRGDWRGVAYVDPDPGAAERVLVDAQGTVIHRQGLLRQEGGDPADSRVIWFEEPPHPNARADMALALMVSSESLGLSRGVGIAVMHPSFGYMGGLNGVVYDVPASNVVLGGTNSGRAIVGRIDYEQYPSPSMSFSGFGAWAFDDRLPWFPKDSAFVEGEVYPARTSYSTTAYMVRGSSGAHYFFSEWGWNGRCEPQAVPGRRTSAEGDRFRSTDDIQPTPFELDLKGPVLHHTRFDWRDFDIRSQEDVVADAVLAGDPGEVRLWVVSGMSTASRTWEFPMPAVPAGPRLGDAARLSADDREIWWKGDDYLFARIDWKRDLARGYFHRGPLDFTQSAAALGSGWRFLAGRDSTGTTADLTLLQISQVAPSTGDGSLAPEWLRRWDGSEAGLYPSAGIEDIQLVGPDSQVLVGMVEGDRYLLDRDGTLVAGGAGWVGPREMAAGSTARLELQVDWLPGASSFRLESALPEELQLLGVELSGTTGGIQPDSLASSVDAGRLVLRAHASGEIEELQPAALTLAMDVAARPSGSTSTILLQSSPASGLERPGYRTIPTDIRELQLTIHGTANPPPAPLQVELLPPRPNPFNPGTTIIVTLPGDGPISLEILDLSGRRIRELWSGWRTGGRVEFHWDGTDDHGRGVSSGSYLVRLLSDGKRQVQRAVLLR